jgi:hypothetical protein
MKFFSTLLKITTPENSINNINIMLYISAADEKAPTPK